MSLRRAAEHQRSKGDSPQLKWGTVGSRAGCRYNAGFTGPTSALYAHALRYLPERHRRSAQRGGRRTPGGCRCPQRQT